MIDVRRGDIAAIRNPFHVALYISLFPQLIAGPIVRAKTVAESIRQRRVGPGDFSAGVRRFVMGLGKKVIIADTLAVTADAAFNAGPNQLPASLAWMGLMSYTLQIYFDFSGYSDMAIGMGRMFGFRFLENFRYPYVARSMSEFWRRWHISLSTWFRDYVYIPLGGNRVPGPRVYVNLVIVFILCGIWHGASWMFVAWGLWHGAFLVIERAGAGAWLRTRPAALRHAYTLAAVVVGWVFFRAATMEAARAYFISLLGLGGADANPGLGFGNDVWLAEIAGTLLSTPFVRRIKLWWRWRCRRSARPEMAIDLLGGMIDMGVWAMILITALALIATGTYSPFIYFRF